MKLILPSNIRIKLDNTIRRRTPIENNRKPLNPSLRRVKKKHYSNAIAKGYSEYGVRQRIRYKVVESTCISLLPNMP